MGLLDGKVVLITGAGGGIGRAHALACAAEGARVVVNDLGSTRDGTGTSRMADAVVAEIRAAGGEAIADHGSVTSPEDCAAMVRAALDTFGRLDVVVNNAGILRDRTFAKMTDDEWSSVIDVHLDGTRNVLRAALPALQDGGGAVINTTSYSGLIGNFGQSNYAAAKAAIYGLTRVLALELRRAGITVNCIAPVAKTRMTADVDVVDDAWTPDRISPIVVFLASDLGRNVTGRVFGVQGQRLHVYEVRTNDGVEKEGDAPWTAAEIAERFDDIVAFPTAPADDDVSDELTEAFSFFPAGFRPGAVPGWKAVIQWRVSGGPDQTIAIDGDTCTVTAGLVGTPTCTIRVDADTLAGMLSGRIDPQQAFLGGKATADDLGELMKLAAAFDFARAAAARAAALGGDAPPAPPAPSGGIPIGRRYDGGFWFVDRAAGEAYARAIDDPNPAWFGEGAVLPPMAHVIAFHPLLMKMATDPDLGLDLLRLVHGEHDMRFHRLLAHGDVLAVRGRLASLEEKASGRVARFDLYGFVAGALALEGTTTFFVRGRTRSGDGPRSTPEPPTPADLVVPQRVTPDQATRYAAASGDDNPIHLDPEAARSAGLPGVILHGLCTLAFAQRDLIHHLAGGDPARLARLGGRFTRPVFPGETLTLKVTGTGGTVRFVTENADGQPVIANGIAEIR